jgi:hypothetical protein
VSSSSAIVVGVIVVKSDWPKYTHTEEEEKENPNSNARK